LGTVSMNMPESNHIFADLGIPYMDTVTGSFAAQTPAKTQFSPDPKRKLRFRPEIPDYSGFCSGFVLEKRDQKRANSL
jgi:hypothetical protein